MRGSTATMGGRLALTVMTVFIIASVLVVMLVRDQLRTHVLHDARERADLLVTRSLAIHSYFNKELKPELFGLTGPVLDEDAFVPSWMSSTYAIRRIGSHADQDSANYYYKECAIDARSPENEADAHEAAFLRILNADPTVQEESGIREIDGEQVFYLLKRGETMEESCLRCHSTPEAAPAEMVAYYGPDRSFGRWEGQVVSAISIRIPVDVAYAEADVVAGRLSGLLLVLLIAVLTVMVAWVRRNAVHPLATMASGARAITDGTKSLREGFGVRGPREVEEVGLAFDALAVELDERITELENAYAALAASSSTRERFLTNLSHELRTPLNSIIGFSDMMLVGHAGPLTDEQRLQLGMVMSSGQHLLRLVEELLEYSAVRAGAVVVTPVDFRPCEVVMGVVRMFEPTASEKGLTLTMGECAHDYTAVTDRFKVEQILINLVGNAVKFTGSGSVTVSPRTDGPDLVVEVEDTGPGIPGEQLTSVFEEFHQVTGDTRIKPTGTGLGLTIARELARMLGGDITLQSAVGEVTVFTLRVPLKYADPA